MRKQKVVHVGLEPTTSRLEGGCAIHCANGPWPQLRFDQNMVSTYTST